jgi:tetratricopeptide (TPR) repeat protein
MFSRIHFVLFTIILIAFGYLFYLNPDEVGFTFLEDRTVLISPALIAFGAFITGAFFVFLVTLFVDTKRAFDLWRSSKRGRRDGMIRERYSDALEEILKGNLQQAKEILLKILEKRPQHLPSYLSLANIYNLDKKYPEAIDTLIRAKAIDPENLELLFDLAENYRSFKDYTLALETLDHILERHSSNREALREKRDIYIQQEKWTHAYQTQKNIVKHTKEKEQIPVEKRILSGMEYRFSEELVKNRNYKEAEKALQEIIDEDRDFFPAHVALGDVLQIRGDSEEASMVWRKAFEISRNPIFLERLESLYLSLADPQKVLHLYYDLFQKHPEDSVLRFFYGRLLVRLEMIDDALETLRDLEITGTPFPELYILMGRAYHRKGDSIRAIEAYEKALEAKKSFSLSYACSACGRTQPEWSPSCENCHAWGTYSIQLPEISKTIPTIPFYSYPYRTE